MEAWEKYKGHPFLVLKMMTSGATEARFCSIRILSAMSPGERLSKSDYTCDKWRQQFGCKIQGLTSQINFQVAVSILLVEYDAWGSVKDNHKYKILIIAKKKKKGEELRK